MDWNETKLPAIVYAARQLEHGLRVQLIRMRVTREAFDAARSQAAPHPIDVMEVTVHVDCEAKGCPACANSGVAHRDTGQPFAPAAAAAAAATSGGKPKPPAAPATSQQLTEQRQRLAEIKAALTRMENLRSQFRLLAELLSRGASSATEIAAELDRLLPKR